MRFSFQQIIIAGITGSLLFCLLLWWLFQYTGYHDLSYLRLVLPTIVMVILGHRVTRDSVQEGFVLYNKAVFRHFVWRILLFVLAAAILLLLIFIGYRVEGGGIGAGYLAFFLILLVGSLFYGYIAIEAIVLLFRKRSRKAYCNLIILGTSLVYAAVLA